MGRAPVTAKYYRATQLELMLVRDATGCLLSIVYFGSRRPLQPAFMRSSPETLGPPNMSFRVETLAWNAWYCRTAVFRPPRFIVFLRFLGSSPVNTVSTACASSASASASACG